MRQITKQKFVDQLLSKDTNNILIITSEGSRIDQITAAMGINSILKDNGKNVVIVKSGQVQKNIGFLNPDDVICEDAEALRDFVVCLDASKTDRLRYKLIDDGENKIAKILLTPTLASKGISEEDISFEKGDYNIDLVLSIGVTNKADVDRVLAENHPEIVNDFDMVGIYAGSSFDPESSDLDCDYWSDTEASSLSEMVFDLVEYLDMESIDELTANTILTGIICETERFKNPVTTSKTMHVSGQLLTFGADPYYISEELLKFAEEPEPEPELEEDPLNTGLAGAVAHEEDEEAEFAGSRGSTGLTMDALSGKEDEVEDDYTYKVDAPVVEKIKIEGGKINYAEDSQQVGSPTSGNGGLGGVNLNQDLAGQTQESQLPPPIPSNDAVSNQDLSIPVNGEGVGSAGLEPSSNMAADAGIPGDYASFNNSGNEHQPANPEASAGSNIDIDLSSGSGENQFSPDGYLPGSDVDQSQIYDNQDQPQPMAAPMAATNGSSMQSYDQNTTAVAGEQMSGYQFTAPNPGDSVSGNPPSDNSAP